MKSRNNLQIRLLMVSLLVASTLAFSGCTRIGPGHVGIKIDLAGSDRGVQDYTIQLDGFFITL